MSPITDRIDTIHASVKQSRWLWRFTWFTRILLAIGFFLPGLQKLIDIPFTQMSTTTDIGYFFDALYQSGFYYNFIGIAQMVAALLLLIPRTATLGAVIYFPIIVNIFVITVSVGFRGTWLITGLMTLASVYLLCWDYDKLKHIVVTSTEPTAQAR